MKINRLLLRIAPCLTIEDFLKYEDRCTGKSLALAFKYISEAMLSGNEVKIVDHFGTINSDRHLVKKVENVIDTLDLVGFEVNSTKNTIKYDIFVEV